MNGMEEGRERILAPKMLLIKIRDKSEMSKIIRIKSVELEGKVMEKKGNKVKS